MGQALAAAGSEQAFESFRGNGTAEIVALRVIAPACVKILGLRPGFHAFGDHAHAKTLAHGDHSGDDGPIPPGPPTCLMKDGSIFSVSMGNLFR
jgi:hypothetical protein